MKFLLLVAGYFLDHKRTDICSIFKVSNLTEGIEKRRGKWQQDIL
jgi:hypothetical protein